MGSIRLCIALAGAGVVAAIGGCSEPETQEDVRVVDSPIKSAVADGERKFDNPLPSGNGRACATCHVEEDGFTLTPAHVAARFAKLPRKGDGSPNYAADPLFASIDADDFAQDFTRLKQGLARVTMPLPANVTIKELPGAREVKLFRSVPSIWNVAITGPYLSDRRAVTLQDQGLGASKEHIRPKVLPSAGFLDAIAAYELDQFSSPGVRFVASELAAGRTPARAEPALNAEQQQGKEIFEFRCAQCHGGPTLNDGPVPTFVSRTLGVSVSRLNRTGLPVYTYQFHMPDGSVVELPSSDPGHSLISGNPDLATEFETFDVPSLYGISKTAPYFHDNSAATLEAVMQHYQEDFAFAKMIGVPDPAVQTPFTDEEMRLIVVYMRTL